MCNGPVKAVIAGHRLTSLSPVPPPFSGQAQVGSSIRDRTCSTASTISRGDCPPRALFAFLTHFSAVSLSPSASSARARGARCSGTAYSPLRASQPQLSPPHLPRRAMLGPVGARGSAPYRPPCATLARLHQGCPSSPARSHPHLSYLAPREPERQRWRRGRDGSGVGPA